MSLIWNFQDEYIGNLKPGIPISLRLISNIDRAELDGDLPAGLMLYQDGRIFGCPLWSNDGKLFDFKIKIFCGDLQLEKKYKISTDSNKRHSFFIILPSGYESAKKSPFHQNNHA